MPSVHRDLAPPTRSKQIANPQIDDEKYEEIEIDSCRILIFPQIVGDHERGSKADKEHPDVPESGFHRFTLLRPRLNVGWGG
jgi:hypothetical protein